MVCRLEKSAGAAEVNWLSKSDGKRLSRTRYENAMISVVSHNGGVLSQTKCPHDAEASTPYDLGP